MLFVGRLFEVGKVMLRELNNKDFREFMTTIAGSEDILEVMEYILQGFVQQQNCKWVVIVARKTVFGVSHLARL